jgi:hypothetical protein
MLRKSNGEYVTKTSDMPIDPIHTQAQEGDQVWTIKTPKTPPSSTAFI